MLCFITETEVKVQYNLELVKAEFGFVQRNLEPQSLLHYPVDTLHLHMNGYTPQACLIVNTCSEAPVHKTNAPYCQATA